MGQVGQRQPSCSPSHLKLLELLLGSGSLGHFEDVEPHGLAERSALSDNDDVSNDDISEARRQVDRDVLVPLLKAVVLADVMKVVTSDNDGPLHLHFGHHTRENTATDGDISGKWAFLVNVSAVNSLSWGFEAQTHTFVVAGKLFLDLLATFCDQNRLLVLEEGGLFLLIFSVCGRRTSSTLARPSTLQRSHSTQLRPASQR